VNGHFVNKKRTRRRRISFDLPLLTRELSDQAGRVGHYVLRSFLATILLLVGFFYLAALINSGDRFRGFTSLGNGPVLFNGILELEFAGILIFVPALTCGAIAGEKERNTLAILLTTSLSPATIVLEKLLSRLFLVFSLLLLSLPLLGFAYALGGLSLEYMIRGVVLLVGTSVLIATLSLMCSAWCGSSASAFFMTHAVGGLICILCLGTVLRRYFVFFVIGGILPHAPVLLASLFGPSLLFFVITVRCLVRRASVTPQNSLLLFFRKLDAIFNGMNALTGNIVLTRETATLPDDAPIAWRETAKKSLGTVRYLVRVLVAIELPTAFLLLIGAEARRIVWMGARVGTVLWLADWAIVAALISVMCANLVSRERTRQTLPVLLATPIPGDRIVKELFAGVRRLVFVLWIPFVTIAGFDYWYHLFPTIWITSEWLVCAVLQLAIYPFLVAWFTFYLGAKIRAPLWATIASLLSVAGAVLLPWIAWPHWYAHEAPPYFLLLSPATIIIANETGKASFGLTIANFAVYGSLLYFIRRLCLRQADRLLGRSEGKVATPASQAVLVLDGARR
jgi:ABC-type transport system involved in multi-copper enzyme maturation permease subunit